MHVAVVERRALAHALRAAASPQERPVDAAAVDDEPARARALERAMAGAGDEELGIRLEGDVVDVGQPTDGDAVPESSSLPARRRRAAERPLPPVRRRAKFHQSPISRPWIGVVLVLTLERSRLHRRMEEPCSDSARRGSA